MRSKFSIRRCDNHALGMELAGINVSCTLPESNGKLQN